MPELPEVETVRRGIEPHLLNQKILGAVMRASKLRYPLDPNLSSKLEGATVSKVQRRAKYLLIITTTGTLLIHLGMSGTLRFCAHNAPLQKHDHVDILLKDGNCLRYQDPRRFGLILWTEGPSQEHSLLHGLGPEPLGADFSGDDLVAHKKNRKIAIKPFIMDPKVVVGIGNIYAAEALFRAGIHPKRSIRRVSSSRLHKLASAIKEVLKEAVDQGGTTLKDFTNADGDLGYFGQDLAVYGREGLPCPSCKTNIKRTVLAQRSTYWCPHCQT